MSSVIKNKRLIKYIIMFFIALLIMKLAIAHEESIDLDGLALIAVPLHLIELVLAVFICFIALKFFQITRPHNLFLVVYVAGGFFVINSLLYILLYAAHLKDFNVSFVNVYLGSRISLIGMLISLGALFYYLNKQMRKQYKV